MVSTNRNSVIKSNRREKNLEETSGFLLSKDSRAEGLLTEACRQESSLGFSAVSVVSLRYVFAYPPAPPLGCTDSSAAVMVNGSNRHCEPSCLYLFLFLSRRCGCVLILTNCLDYPAVGCVLFQINRRHRRGVNNDEPKVRFSTKSVMHHCFRNNQLANELVACALSAHEPSS